MASDTEPRRLLIVGATGMLGHQVFLRAREDPRFVVHTLTRRKHPILESAMNRAHLADARDESAVNRILDEIKPELIVNCLGVVKSIAHDPAPTIALNSLFPHQLAAAADRHGARLIHVSTDCVFSGERGDYSETDNPDPVDLYGRSKLLGEVYKPPHLTARTSFIGREIDTRNGLLEWFLAQNGTVNGFVNAIWTGLVAPELARVLLELALRPHVTGLMHVASERVSKYDLLVLMRDAFRRSNVDVLPYEEFHCDRSLRHDRFDALDIPVTSLREQLQAIA